MATQLAKESRGFGDHLTAAEEDAIVARLRQGVRYVAIAAESGVSIGTVSRIKRAPVVVPGAPLTPYMLGALAAQLIKTPHDREEFQRSWQDAREEAARE